MSDSTVLLASNLAWPIAVLIMATLLLVSQRESIGKLIDRVIKLNYPGGALETPIPEQGAQTILSLVDMLSRDMSERVVAPPARPGLIDPMQNREPLSEFEPLPTEEVTNLVMLRTKAANLLSELAVPPPLGGFGSVSATISVLRNRAVLDEGQARALRDTLDLADQAAAGAAIPRKVALAAENSGPAILEQLALRRTVAAARFEDHVLDVLQLRLPSGWMIETDAAVLRSRSRRPDAGAEASSALASHARVDALITADNREVVLEVRARLEPGAHGQVRALRTWLEALPSELPVLLVVLGEGLTERQLDELRQLRAGAVMLLQWDRDSNSLISTLRDLIEDSGN